MKISTSENIIRPAPGGQILRVMKIFVVYRVMKRFGYTPLGPRGPSINTRSLKRSRLHFSPGIDRMDEMWMRHGISMRPQPWVYFYLVPKMAPMLVISNVDQRNAIVSETCRDWNCLIPTWTMECQVAEKISIRVSENTKHQNNGASRNGTGNRSIWGEPNFFLKS